MTGQLDETVIAHLKGGDLSIQWAGEGRTLLMTGPATTVFDGKINLDN